jgi:hypothetical protein
VVLAAAVGLWNGSPEFLPSLAPDDAGEAMNNLWQVHAVFVSLAFAGLAVLLQIGSEQLVTGTSLRAALFDWTWFKFSFAFSVISLVQLGAVTIWFGNDATLLLEFFFVDLVAIALVAFAYYRAATVYADPLQARRMALEHLRATAERSQRYAWSTEHANSRLLAIMPDLFSLAPQSKGMRRDPMAAPDKARTVADIHVRKLAQALEHAKGMAAASAASIATDADRPIVETVPGFAPTLRLQTWIGNIAGPMQPAFYLFHEGLTPRQLERLSDEIYRCIRWENDD